MPSSFTLGAIQKFDLTDSAVQHAFQEKVRTMVLFDQAEKALWMSKIIQTLLLEKPELATNPSARAWYEQLFVQCQWGALNLLPDKAIIELFEHHAGEALDMPDYAIWDKLKAKLLGMLVFEERDVLKKAVREALERNTQIITQQKLLSRGEEIAPTISNWIKVYVQITGTGPADPVKHAQFFFQDPSMRRVDGATRTKLMKLFRLHERLRLSSLTAQGVEEAIPVPVGATGRGEGVIRDGVFEPLDPVQVRQFTKDIAGFGDDVRNVALVGTSAASVLALLEENPEEQEGMRKEEAALKETTDGVHARILDALYQSCIPPNPITRVNVSRARAALRALAISGAMADTMVRDARVAALVETYLQSGKRAQELQSFRASPGMPLYVGLTLRILLQDKLGLPESEAARSALQLFMLLRKAGKDAAYERLVYYDMSDGQFHWKE